MDPNPQDPSDLDLGPTFLDPADPGLKTDLDPGPLGPGPDPTRCHPYSQRNIIYMKNTSSLIFCSTICHIFLEKIMILINIPFYP